MNFENQFNKPPQESKGEEQSENKKIEKADLVEFTIKGIAEHIAGKPGLQEKIFGKVLDEKELENLEHNITADIMIKGMESMGLRLLTLDEVGELKTDNPEEVAKMEGWLMRIFKENS